MTLYDYIKENPEDFDVWDDTYDMSVTVCAYDDGEPDDENDLDDYDKFCAEICKKVQLVEGKNYPDDCELIADWTGMIMKNKEKFVQFSNLYWNQVYNDPDDFAYQWVKEIHLYFAGYVADSFYKTLYEFSKSLD